MKQGLTLPFTRHRTEAVCDIIARSQALGFMAEMCIELLDDESVLDALASARCRMVIAALSLWSRPL